MPEQTCFIFFFDNKEKLPDRRLFIEQLLASVSIWLHEPTEVLRFDYNKDETPPLEAWNETSILSEPLGETELLFVYAKPQDEEFARDSRETNNLSVHEQGNIADYTIGIHLTQLLPYAIGYIEECLIGLLQTALRYSTPVMFSGSEVGGEEEHKTAAQIVNNALERLSESYWVFAEDKYLPAIPDTYEVVARLGGGYLLRRRELLIASGFHM